MTEKNKSVDVFDQLLPVKWRDVEFPITRTRMSLAHDLVEHKYWGVDGARVEATGLAPMRFTFSAPLTNGIVSGKNERWSILYPTAFRALLLAFRMKETGPLQHPEFGTVNCKAERLDVDWDATKRGGVDAELSFVETLPDVGEDIFEPSRVQDVHRAAGNLDASETKADLESLLAGKGIKLPKFVATFGDLARKVQGVFDTVTVLDHRAAGQIKSMVYRGNQIADACDRAKDARTWPVKRSVEIIRAAAHELEQNLLAQDRDIAFYRVPADTTLAGVARQLEGAKVGDLIKLNPKLMTHPEISEGTVVRYYTPRVAA